MAKYIKEDIDMSDPAFLEVPENKQYTQKEIESYEDGEYYDNGFYYLPDGDFFDCEGYYFYADGKFSKSIW